MELQHWHLKRPEQSYYADELRLLAHWNDLSFSLHHIFHYETDEEIMKHLAYLIDPDEK